VHTKIEKRREARNAKTTPRPARKLGPSQ
jgi:hypothetical protein